MKRPATAALAFTDKRLRVLFVQKNVKTKLPNLEESVAVCVAKFQQKLAQLQQAADKARAAADAKATVATKALEELEKKLLGFEQSVTLLTLSTNV